MKKKLNCVLLVDDDEATNYLNKMFLEDAEVAEEIIVALNGVEAINYLTSSEEFNGKENFKETPDLILLDINMPIMDGWEFIETYRKLKKDQKGKVVIAMLTTSLNPDDQLKASKFREISAYKTKPLSFEMIDEIIENYFPHHL